MRIYQEGFRAGRSFASLELKTMIPEWVIGHINKTDFHAFSLEKLEEIIRRSKTWDELSPFIKKTNVFQVDQEHRAIGEILLEFNNLPPEVSVRAVSSLARKLELTAADHFTHEEILLRDRKIGLTEDHVSGHRSFLERIKLWETAGPGDWENLRWELASWLVNHVNREDSQAFHHGRWLLPLLRESREADDVLTFLVRLGVDVLDRDHQGFIRRAFALFPALEGEDLDDEALLSGAEGIRELGKFAREHFAREEHLMENLRHPIVEKHHQEHADILEELESTARDFADGLIASRAAVKERLIHWWLEHTNQTDVETFRDWRASS